MLAAACCACDRLAPERSVYRPQEAGTVDQALCLLGFTGSPLRTAVTGHHLVDVELNGVSGVFVLDTGANISVVDQRSAATFSLTPSRLVLGAGVRHWRGSERGNRPDRYDEYRRRARA